MWGSRRGGGGGSGGGDEVQEVEWGRSGGGVGEVRRWGGKEEGVEVRWGRRGGVSISSITCVTRNVQQWIMKVHKMSVII